MRNVALASMLALGGALLVPGCVADTNDPEQPANLAAEISENAPDQVQHVQWQRGMAPQHGGSTTSNLVDHGGRVLASSNTYAIWWGPTANFPSDAQKGIDALFSGFNGSSFLGVGDQYMRGAKTTTSFHTNWSDTTTALPKSAPQTSAIVNEACKAITANGATPDPTAIYFVFTSNFAGHTNYCAWHSSGTCNGVSISVAYMPNVSGMAGCDPGNLYSCNSYSQGTRALANVTSHEYMEAITDALPGSSTGAWTDSSGSEIGDKCAWQFSSCVNLGSGNSWQLQEEWSNSVSGCVQQ